MQGLVPIGRAAAAEATRASLLARWVGAGRVPAAAATRMQSVVLAANAAISIPAAIAVLVVVGPGMARARDRHQRGRHARARPRPARGRALGGKIGAWLGRRSSRARAFGAELDGALAGDSSVPWRAIAWESTGRLAQVAQNAVLIACVGGVVGVGTAFCAEGIHLVGAAVGDLVPAQLGATEGNFTLAAGALGLSHASAVSIALLAHVTQLVWVSVGSIVPLVWRPPATQESV